METKRYLPYLAAIIIFVIVTAFFFSPTVFEGKQIRQGDITHYNGVSKEIVDYREKTGQEALWTNSLFSGMPAYQISVLYPNNFVQYIQKTFLKIFPTPVAMILLCMVGFYFLLTTLKVDPWLAIAGAIAFGLSSYFIIIIPAGHNTKGFAIGYMAPVLMGVLITLRGRLFLGAAITAIALALEIYSNHLQITYYLAIVILFVGIGEAIRLFQEGKMNYLFKAMGLLCVAAILAILPNITNLMLTNEYGKESTRGQSDITLDAKEQNKTTGLPIEYATQWSYGKGETFTLLIPDFSGGASQAIASYDPKALDDVDEQYKEYIGGQSAYFGDVSFTSGPVYVGAIICFLFILGLFIVKDSIKWWLLGATVLSIMLAWGRHFMGFTEFFFDHIPGYNKFRAVSMILVIAELTMPILAMLAVREIVTRTGLFKEKMNNWYLTVFKKFTVFKGRASRSEYWYFFLFNVIVSSILPLFQTGFLEIIYAIAVLIPALAVGFRRMQDVNKSGWFIFVPVYNIILACTKGTSGENKYGEDPEVEDSSEKISVQNIFIISFVLTAGLTLLIYFTPGTFVSPVSDNESAQIIAGVQKQGGSVQVADEVVANLETARLALVKSDALRSFFFILLAGGLLFVYIRKPFGKIALAGGLTLLMLVDMWGVSSRYISDEKGNSDYEKPRKTESSFVQSKADEIILQDKSPDYRVLNVAVATWQDASTSYWHKSIGGYHGAKLKRMQELYEQVMDGNVNAIRSGLQVSTNDSMMREVLSHQSALNMLNTKYIIYNPEGGVLTNRYACGNAWFVRDVKFVANADEELTGIKTFNPKSTALIEKSFANVIGEVKPKYDSTATISLTSYSPNNLKYSSTTASEQLAVFSEVYYEKGWNAYVDGKLTPHVRADFVLRAMKVPAGKHEIEFKFEPTAYYSGEKISLAGSILLFLFLGAGIYMDRKRKPENAKAAA